MTEVAHSVFVSARSDEWDVIEEYVTKFGNDVNELDDLGFTGLHICATTGAVAAAHTYLTHGANLSIADRESGWLALHRSLYFKHIKVSLLLLAFGATIDGGVDNTKSKGTLHIYDNEGLSPSALLSRMLASRPAMNNRVSNVAYSFGKSDFTLGIPLPNAARVAQAKRLETLLDKRLKQVCAGKHHSLAITEDGQLFSWGYGRWGRLGQGNEVDQPEPGLISALWQAKIYVKQVASGEHHTIAVSSEGDVYTWGSDRCGQLGHGKSLRSQQHVVRKDSASQDKEIDNEVLLSEPRRVEALRRSFVLQVAAGDAHSLCFAKGDELYAWGSNRSGQLGLKATELSHLPGGAEGTSTPKAVYIEHAGKPRRSSVMRKASSSSHRPSPEVMVQLAAAHNNSLLLCRNANLDTQGGLVRGSICSEVFQWGHGIFDPARLQFSSRESSRTVFTKNNGDNNPTSEFTAVGKAKHIKITQITAGQHHFAGVCSDGCVYTWKVEGGDCSVEPAAVGPERREERIDERISAKGSLSAPKVFEAMLPERGGGHVTHVAASSRRMSATTADGDLFTWDLHGGKGERGLGEPQRVVGVKRATSVSVGADYTLLLSAVSHPPLPLSDCEIYRTLMVDPVPQGRVEEGGEGFNDQETTDLVGLEEENTPSHRASYEVSEVINKEKAAGEEEKEDDGTIPSLFAICQRQVAKTVNTKTVLSSLNFADNFDAQLLSAYCTEYTQMNFDLILAQTKQAEIEKFVEGMGFSLKLRAGVKASTQPAGAPAPPALGSGVRPAHQPRSGIRETTAPPVARKVEIKIVAAPEKKVDPSSSEEVKKQIRNIKKKLTVIQELQDRQRTDKTFELSKEQKDKVQKRESLHQEMAHLEQLLVRCEVRERNSNSNNNNISSYSSASEEKKNKDESGDCFVLSSCTAAAAEVSICSAAQDALSPVEAKAVLSVPKKKKFSKGISLQEFNKVISSSGGGVPANLESWGKAVPSSKQSSPLVHRSAEQSASKPSPWKKISVATSRASATEHPSELNWESNGTALPQVAASSPSTTSTKAMLLTPNKNPPSASSAVTHQQSTASEILGGSPRKAFALADFLPGSGSGRKASSVIATTPQSAQSQSKACWGSPATIATTPSTRSLSQAAASRPSSAAAPAAALTPAPTLAPVNFSDIQRAEEAARQRSNIAALRGNNIPWYVERRPRAESLEHVIRQQALDKAVEEEHHRLKSMYFPPPEQSREKKATGRQEHRKKKPPDDKYKKSTANSKKSHKKSTV